MITIIKCNYNLMPSDTCEFNAWVKIKPKGKNNIYLYAALVL